MALLITKDNKPVFLQAKQANLLWLVSTGERKATPLTEYKAKQVKKWYLNRDSAPRSYLVAHPEHYYTRPMPKLLPYQIRLPYAD